MKHFAPLPGSDGLLALGLAGALIQKGSKPMPGEGLTEYLCLAASLEITEVCLQTGLSREEFDELLSMLSQGPVQFWLGYGLQRYYDSVNTVRHIDALAATLGSIGISGGGVNYAHTWWDDILDYLALTLHPPCPRETFPKSRLGEFLAAEKPDLLFITKANPAVQAPDLAKVRQGLASTGFSVVFEHFYTDTARLADLVLPTTGFLEETDLYLSNMWHGVINYAQPVLKPPGQARPEREVFQFLAQELGLDFPHKSDDAWLEDLLRPASSWGITLEELQKESRGHPPFIPWQNQEFATQHRAFAYVSTLPQPSLPPPGKIRLLTPHQADNMHSQLFEPGHQEHVLKLHPTTSEKFMLVDGGLADLTSGQGTLRCRIKINSDIARDLGVISQGIPCWRAGQGVNILTPAKPTDGDGAAYNECFCSITPLTGL